MSLRNLTYYELGIPPGVPTMKGAYGDPENTGVGYNTIITELGDHSVPKNWEQFVVKRDKGETPGPPIIWSDPQDPEDAQPGYGFIADDTNEEETFFYHSDHLGSTSYITDDKGNITQYTAYLPYGELLVDAHSSSEELPYKFNGKASMKEDLAQPFGKSVDMKISLYVARKLDIELKNKELTFVGHSKGGAEAAANAVATNREGVLFNPAAVNLKGYDLDSRKYDKSRHHITAFVVIGEFLDESINKMAKPIDKKIMLTPLSSPKGTFERHKMETVINILKEKNNENKK